jgi:hypothetical protein
VSDFKRSMWAAMCAVSSLVMACDVGPVPEYVVGQGLGALTFNLHTANMGVHPDTSVMQDPNNPFADSTIGAQTRWEVAGDAGPIAAFYLWATVLVHEGHGEAQFFTASALDDIYSYGLASASALPYVRLMAIAGYQSLLDNFPDAVSYNADGVSNYPLAPLAYDGIVALGGTVQGGWIVIESAGKTTVIQVDDDAPVTPGEEGP